ncbi:LPS-assembly lipoprotein LptE [Aidingimonas lacisalsi]|uniref:LPS-assembly lipoprotein LptE n=1 Tax=Aidingimonas lacisalsi TaxID=2604086 RepID=UPI0011D1C0B2|nr:LPS assembly lipoprotein LptE [Aidingimonas lacisalsi]
MRRRTFLTHTLALMGAASLTGCGFQLRGLGSDVATIDSLALDAADSDLTSVVRSELESGGTRLDDAAPLRLNLGKESLRQSVLTFGSAGSREIELTLTAPFSVQRSADDAYLMNQEQIEVTTSYSVNDDNLLAQDDLRAEATERLRQEAARQLLDRLRPLAER